jgi:hypothetical protein
MKVVCAIVGICLLAAAAAATPGEVRTFITKEWIWSDGPATVTFTASGAADQVNRLDPATDPLACAECELASSVRFGGE